MCDACPTVGPLALVPHHVEQHRKVPNMSTKVRRAVMAMETMPAMPMKMGISDRRAPVMRPVVFLTSSYCSVK